MEKRLRSYYLETRVSQASPGQLLIMLYDGLIEHAECADREITSTIDMVFASREVSRCIDILSELNACLKHDVDPKLCQSLGDLYLFFTKQFIEALEQHDAGKIRAILPLLHDLRGAWIEADRRTNKYEADGVAVAA